MARRFHRSLPVLLILLLGVFLRFHAIETQSLWHDEGNSLRLAERELDDLIEAAGNDIHPPGYYIILKGWIGVMGDTEFGLRSLSAFWSVIAVASAYALGNHLFGKSTGLIAGLLVAVSPFAVYYAQETRMYAQLAALSIFSLWVMVRMMKVADVDRVKLTLHRYATPIAPWAFLLAGTNIIGLYTHYTYPFTMLVQGIFFTWWMVYRPVPRSRVVFVALNVLTLMLFQPWLPTAYDQISTWPASGDETSTFDRLDRFFTVLVYGPTQLELSILAYIIPAILLTAGILIPDKRSSKVLPSNVWRIGLPAALIVLCVGALLVSGAYREANLKFLLPAQIAMMLLLARGAVQIAHLPGRFPLGAAVLPTYVFSSGVALLLVGLVFATNSLEVIDLYDNPALARSDYRGIAETIEENPRASDAVILNAPNQVEVFSYYYNGAAPVYPLPPGLGGNDPETREKTLQVIDNHARIFLVLWGQQERDPRGVVQGTLDEKAYVLGREWYGDVELVQYAVLGPPPTEPDTVIDVCFGEDIVLRGYALSEEKLVTGDVLGVTLFWQAMADITTRYKVSVQLLKPNGSLASQHDSEPANGRAITTSWPINTNVADNHGLVIYPDLPTGEYTLNVIMYNINNPSVEGRLVPTDCAREPLGDHNNAYSLAVLELVTE